MGESFLRGIFWIVRRIGAQTLLAAGLLLLAIISGVSGISSLTRAADTGDLLSIAFLAIILSSSLASLRKRIGSQGFFLLPLLLLTGFLLLFIQAGDLGDEIEAFRQSMNQVQIRLHLSDKPIRSLLWTVDYTALKDPIANFGLNARALVIRFNLWFGSAISRGLSHDPVITSLFWKATIWWAVLWAGWVYTRWQQAFTAVFPIGAILASACAYSRQGSAALVILIGTIWMLHILVTYRLTTIRWADAGADTPDLRYEVTGAAVFITMTLMAGAFTIPSISFERIEGFIHEFLPNGKSTQLQPDSLGLQVKPVSSSITELSRTGGLPRRHLISTPPEILEREVLSIELQNFPPGSAPPEFYWRSLVYDLYGGNGWHSSSLSMETVQAQTPLFDPSREYLENSRLFQQHVQKKNGMADLVFAAGELYQVDYPVQVAWRSIAESSEDQENLNKGDPLGAQIEVSDYLAWSYIPIADVEDLRGASREYPEWLARTYLSLPESLPMRVRELASKLIGHLENPYDQAIAIQAYLRLFPYTLDLPSPPENRDVVDYFLFDLKRGYCDYYASAMVILARAAGLPARFVIGYSTGTWNPTKVQFEIKEANAHSWPEIFFPGYGWIPFEPTAGLPERTRSASTQVGVEGNVVSEGEAEHYTTKPFIVNARLLNIILLSLGSLVFILVLLWWIDYWRLCLLRPGKVEKAIYSRLYRHGQRLKLSLNPGITPDELVGLLGNQMAVFGQIEGQRLLRSRIMTCLILISKHYDQYIYSNRNLNQSEKRASIVAWREIRLHLWFLWLKMILKRKHNQTRIISDGDQWEG